MAINLWANNGRKRSNRAAPVCRSKPAANIVLEPERKNELPVKSDTFRLTVNIHRRLKRKLQRPFNILLVPQSNKNTFYSPTLLIFKNLFLSQLFYSPKYFIENDSEKKSDSPNWFVFWCMYKKFRFFKYIFKYLFLWQII